MAGVLAADERLLSAAPWVGRTCALGQEREEKKASCIAALAQHVCVPCHSLQLRCCVAAGGLQAALDDNHGVRHHCGCNLGSSTCMIQAAKSVQQR